MQLDIVHLIIAIMAGVGAGGLVYWRQHRFLSMPKIVFSAIGIAFAVYYILYVVLGEGRTGWP